MAPKSTLLTQDGDPTENGDNVARALAVSLLTLPTGDAPTTGMVLKLTPDGLVGWYPARMQVPPLPYIAPVPGVVKPVATDLIAQLSATTATLNNLVLEHRNLVQSHNELMASLVANGYMLPKTA